MRIDFMLRTGPITPALQLPKKPATKPAVRLLRHDPRFQNLVRRMDFPNQHVLQSPVSHRSYLASPGNQAVRKPASQPSAVIRRCVHEPCPCQHVNLRLESKNRYIVHINPQAAGYSQTQLESLYRTIEERFHAIPGVKNVGISLYTPMEDNNWGTGVQVKGQPNLHVGASVVKVNSEYFDSVGTHVLTGRGISERDTSTAPAVAVVNQQFTKKFFPGQNPIGRYFRRPRFVKCIQRFSFV